MLFKKNVLLKSSYPIDKLFERLEATMVFDIKTTDKRKFKGRVDRNTSTFLISQSINGFETNSFRPQIKGVISSDLENHTTLITLNFTLPKSIKVLLVTLLILNTTVYIANIFLNFISINKQALIIAVPIAALLFLLQMVYFFNTKTSEAIDDLSFIFGAREI